MRDNRFLKKPMIIGIILCIGLTGFYSFFFLGLLTILNDTLSIIILFVLIFSYVFWMVIIIIIIVSILIQRNSFKRVT